MVEPYYIGFKDGPQINAGNAEFVGSGVTALGGWANNMIASVEKIDRIKNPEKYARGGARNQVTGQTGISDIKVGKPKIELTDAEKKVFAANPALAEKFGMSNANVEQAAVEAKATEQTPTPPPAK